MEYIIVQAGGKGTRLKHLTSNKPKALVPVQNLPMLFHLFKKYPDKKYIIIADYKKEVLHEYLECFAKVKYQIVDAAGTGTCAGVSQAIDLLPEKEPFMLIWSDLILPEGFKLPTEYEESSATDNYIGISKTFECRWSYMDNSFVEESSTEHGVAGFFLFTEKKYLENVSESGELVRFMQQSNMEFKELSLASTREFGLLEEYNRLEQEKCRPFNKMTFLEDKIIKEAVDEQGQILAQRECAWYKAAKELNISVLPKIYATNPLQLERINGKNVYEYRLSYSEKREILKGLVEELKKLHGAVKVNVDTFSIKEAYYYKTINRINKVRDLIPMANEPVININGKKCRNVFFHKRELERRLSEIKCQEFCFIHGDCTFSNIMLKDMKSPILIDPRGYFGYTELFGDELYDWAKLYYSIVGNYDRFNLKDFRLNIDTENKEVDIKIASNQWEDMEKDFFLLTGADEQTVKLLHAVIWLSLTTYAWQDYDSICGAFYNGLYYLEEIL